MNIVTIRRAAETIVGEELGNGFGVHALQQDVEMNESRSLAAGYSVLWMAAQESPEQMDQKVSLTQELRVTITKQVGARNRDDKMIDAMDDVYGSVETILTRFIQDRLDRADIIQEVRLSGMEAPRTIGRDVVLLEIAFRVRYLLA